MLFTTKCSPCRYSCHQAKHLESGSLFLGLSENFNLKKRGCLSTSFLPTPQVHSQNTEAAGHRSCRTLTVKPCPEPTLDTCSTTAVFFCWKTPCLLGS